MTNIDTIPQPVDKLGALFIKAKLHLTKDEYDQLYRHTLAKLNEQDPAARAVTTGNKVLNFNHEYLDLAIFAAQMHYDRKPEVFEAYWAKQAADREV